MSSDTRVSRIPYKKSQKIGCENGGDRISSLPDCVISCILNCLPTKDAVRTCVLSKDWEYKWTSIYNIDLNDTEQFSKKRSSKAAFVKFVERLLLMTEDVKSFHIECQENHGVSRMTTWMFSVLKRNLRSLKVVYDEAGIILPHKLLNCCFLEKLELVLPCTFKVPGRISFGSLTTLHLEGVDILSEDSTTDSVMFDFPVLETFELKRCKWLNVKFVEIYAPKMTSFESETPGDAVVNDYSIRISGESLLVFESYGGFPENIVVSGSAVVYAALGNISQRDSIHLLSKSGLQVRKLLKGFSSLEELEISYIVAKAIALSKLGHSLPRFTNLEQLVISGYPGTMLELLHAAPSLKCLIINMIGWGDCNYDAEKYVPSCIESHLEEVKFECFSGVIHEFKLAKYLLKNAVKLRKFILSHGNRYLIPKDEIVEELSTYPQASTCLTVFVL